MEFVDAFCELIARIFLSRLRKLGLSWVPTLSSSGYTVFGYFLIAGVFFLLFIILGVLND